MARLSAAPARPLPALRATDVVILDRGAVLVRVYTVRPHGSTWNTFRRYGPTQRGRFDHHPPPAGDHPAHGILYAAGDATTAIVEAFQAAATIDRHRREPWIASFTLARRVVLLDLGGSWPTRAGSSQALVAADHPSATQAWARAIHEDYPDMSGVVYPSAMRGAPAEPLPRLVDARLLGRNVALFERAALALPAHPRLHLRLDHPGLGDLLASIAEAYGYDIV